MLLAFRLLPGETGDTLGVVAFGLAGIGVRISPLEKFLLPLLAVGAGVILIVTQTGISGVVASNWIRCDGVPDSGLGAVVVLSASVNTNQTMSPEALDHLLTGLELTAAGKAPLLVATTVHQVFPTGLATSETDQSRIVELFGRQIRWIRTRPGKSTRDEAVNVAALLLPQGIRRIAVVASPMHTRRACSTFEAVGFVVSCVKARSRSPDGAASGSWPRDRLTLFGDWVYELASTAKYRMKGWLATKPTRQSSPLALTDSTSRMSVAPARHPWCD
jgi:uncharacterized SAM-binding protein YcdF (DUF218 family)